MSSNANSAASKYKYNGKELEQALGVDWYEMDMRQYDPAIARWTAIDPVTHHSTSTYTAFDNNPVFWADPSGADSEVSEWFDMMSTHDQNRLDADARANDASKSSSPDDWVYNKKSKKYVWKADVTSEDDEDLDNENEEYVGIGRSDVQRHFDNNNNWIYELLFYPDIDEASYNAYLSEQISMKISDFFNNGSEIDLNDIRGIFNNFNPYSINKYRISDLPIDLKIGDLSFNGKAYAEIKLFSDGSMNKSNYVRDESQLFAQKVPYQFEFYSSNTKALNPQPIIHLFIQKKGVDLYDAIKSAEKQ